jgi:hypothetical protein
MTDPSPTRASVSPRPLASTVRIATRDDVPLLGELLAGGPPPWSETVRESAMGLTRSSSTFVLDFLDGGLAAAAHVRLSADPPVLDLMVVSADADDEEIRSRLIGIAEALCSAHGRGPLAIASPAAADRR